MGSSSVTLSCVRRLQFPKFTCNILMMNILASRRNPLRLLPDHPLPAILSFSPPPPPSSYPHLPLPAMSRPSRSVLIRSGGARHARLRRRPTQGAASSGHRRSFAATCRARKPPHGSRQHGKNDSKLFEQIYDAKIAVKRYCRWVSRLC